MFKAVDFRPRECSDKRGWGQNKRFVQSRLSFKNFIPETWSHKEVGSIQVEFRPKVCSDQGDFLGCVQINHQSYIEILDLIICSDLGLS